MARDLLDAAALTEAVATLDDAWAGTPDALTRSIEFADFPTAVGFVSAIVDVCESLDHHPDLGVHWRRVDITLTTHSAGGVTELDVVLAARLDEIAAGFALA